MVNKMLNTEDCLLLIIDIQEKLVNAAFNRDTLQQRASILTKAASILEIPVFITEQYPKGLGSTIDEIKSVVKEPKIIEKTDFNAFADKNIHKEFKKLNKKQVILCGIETHICVHQTAEYLLSKGYSVSLASDACGSRSENEHFSGIETIKSNGAQIKTTEMILFELLRTSKHPKFKEIQNLIK